MFGRREEDQFVNRPAQMGGDGGGWLLLLVIAAGIGAFVAWAATHRIEETVRAPGRVIPSQQVQIVQSLEGGIVRELLVGEGDEVQPGDLLMRIDDTRFVADEGSLLEREGALLAEAARLEAEAGFAEAPAFPDTLAERNALAVLAEEQLFRSQRDRLNRELQVLDDKLHQRRSELLELRAERARSRAVLAPLSEEIAQTEDLVAKGVVPQVELLRLRSRQADLEGEIAVSEAGEARVLAAIAEAEGQIGAARSAYVLSARQRLARLQLELAVVQEDLRAARDRVRRAGLRAPVHGTVNQLHVTTLGAVVQPAQPLIEIVPVDDRLLIEADLNPRDIAFVRPGTPVSVKITAYDYLIYGALEGKVLRIGADTLETRDGAAFFRVVVQTGRTHLGSDTAPLPITPGMGATVDILTGERTVLSYLAKPLLRARSEALRER